MGKHVARLGVAALCSGIAALPGAAAAADFYDGGDPPLAFHGRVARGDRRAPGPVVFDAREPDRFAGGPAFREPRLRLPAPLEDRYGDPVPLAPPVAFYGDGRGYRYRPEPFDRPAAVFGFEDRYGRPERGCTTEQVESTTPFGWRKIVTHRTCYRR